MESAYNNLSNKSKALLDKPVQQSIANAIATYANDNTAINIALIIANVFLALLIICPVVVIAKCKNAKKKEGENK